MTKDEILDIVGEEAITYDNLDSAIIGVAERCGMPDVVCYDYDKLIEGLKAQYSDENIELDSYEIEEGLTIDDKKEQMAVEWYDYNIKGGYLGEYTPIVVRQNY